MLFYHTCRFSTLTINFSEVWPRQILELGKQFNLMIRLQNILKASLQDVLKMSWRRFCKTSWRRLENVLKTSWQDVLKTSWKRLEDVLKTYGQDEYIGLDQDVLKTSSEDVRLRRTYSSWSRHLEDVFKTSSEDEDERRLQDVFIKTNVCWASSFWLKFLNVLRDLFLFCLLGLYLWYVSLLLCRYISDVSLDLDPVE